MSSRTNGIATSLIPEFDLEMANTRKVLERVPEADFAWKPHAKSFSMGELAGHVASIPGWMTSTLVDDAFDVSPGGVPASFPKAASAKEAGRSASLADAATRRQEAWRSAPLFL